MRARAPGKVVLSGAYAVLEGAACIATAVDRYVTVDASLPADHIAAEVAAAMSPPYPRVDASELRSGGRKLGLGSSAAIVVASLAVRHPEWLDHDQGVDQLFIHALQAHRQAQGGGSGVDVAVATRGGTLSYCYDRHGAGHTTAIALPPGHLEVWVCPHAASTKGFLAQVAALRQRDPALHARVFDTLMQSAGQAHDAVTATNQSAWLAALDATATGLDALGHAAGIPIFTPEVRRLREQAAREAAVVMPAGAGGGDIALFAAGGRPSARLCELRTNAGLEPLSLQLGARGVHLLDEP